MVALLFFAVLIIPAIWLWLFVKERNEDAELKSACEKTPNRSEPEQRVAAFNYQSSNPAVANH